MKGSASLFGAFLHGVLLSLGLILPIGMQNGFVLTQGSVQRRWINALPTVVTAALCDTLLIAVAVLGASSLAVYMMKFRLVLGVIGIAFLAWMGWKLISAGGKAITPVAAAGEDAAGVAAGSATVVMGDMAQIAVMDETGVAGVAVAVAVAGVAGVAGENTTSATTVVRASGSRQGEEPWSPKAQVGFAMSTSLLNPHAWMDTVAIIGGTALAYTNLSERAAFSLACVGVSWVWFATLAWVGRAATSVLLRGRAQARMNQISGLMMWASAIYLAVVLVH